MPIYEFKCNECGIQFDQLCSLNWQNDAKCPVCGKKNLKKLLSAFASTGGTIKSGCQGCSGKNCSTCH